MKTIRMSNRYLTIDHSNKTYTLIVGTISKTGASTDNLDLASASKFIVEQINYNLKKEGAINYKRVDDEKRTTSII